MYGIYVYCKDNNKQIILCKYDVIGVMMQNEQSIFIKYPK